MSAYRETLFDRMVFLTSNADVAEPVLYAHESRTYDVYGGPADVRTLDFFTNDGEKDIDLGYLKYYEFLPSDDRDIGDLMMEADAIDGEPHVVFEAISSAVEEEPWLRTVYVLKVHVAEEWRGMGLAKFMLIAAPVLLQGQVDLFTIYPYRAGDEADTARLQSLVRECGYSVSPADPSVFIKTTGDDHRRVMEDFHMMLTTDGPHMGEPVEVSAVKEDS